MHKMHTGKTPSTQANTQQTSNKVSSFLVFLMSCDLGTHLPGVSNNTQSNTHGNCWLFTQQPCCLLRCTGFRAGYAPFLRLTHWKAVLVFPDWSSVIGQFQIINQSPCHSPLFKSLVHVTEAAPLRGYLRLLLRMTSQRIMLKMFVHNPLRCYRSYINATRKNT